MDIVVDANLTVALFVNLPYSSQCERLFGTWRSQDVQLHAPALWPAEVVSALRKMVSVSQISIDDAWSVLANLERIPIRVILPESDLLKHSLMWASRINQSVAYDAQYIALAEKLSAEFWSADQKLIQALQRLDKPWAHWVGEAI